MSLRPRHLCLPPPRAPAAPRSAAPPPDTHQSSAVVCAHLRQYELDARWPSRRGEAPRTCSACRGPAAPPQLGGAGRDQPSDRRPDLCAALLPQRGGGREPSPELSMSRRRLPLPISARRRWNGFGSGHLVVTTEAEQVGHGKRLAAVKVCFEWYGAAAIGQTRLAFPSCSPDLTPSPSPRLAMHYPHLAGRAAGVPWPLLQPPLPSAAVLSVHRHWF
jgi:hypothetical protein